MHKHTCNKVVLLALMAILLPSLAKAFPPEIEAVVPKACQQTDRYVGYAIIRALQQDYPEYRHALQIYWEECPDYSEELVAEASQPKNKTDEAVANVQSIPEKGFLLWGDHYPVDGEIEAGADIRTGNTEKQDVLLRGKFQYDDEETLWRHSLEALARSNEDDGEVTAEEYRLGWRTDYQFNKDWFAFGELGYVKDRFSGYRYRLSEVLGIGHILYHDKPLKWEVRSGIGLRQDKLTDGTDDNNGMILLATDLDWVIRDGLTFFEYADASLSPDSSIFQSETGVKSLLIDNLSLKAAFYVEHITDVPADTKDTDTRTTVGLLYDF